MPIKIFTNDDKKKLEDEINQWEATAKPTVDKLNTNISTISVPVTAIVNGKQKKTSKKVAIMTTTIWYK